MRGTFATFVTLTLAAGVFGLVSPRRAAAQDLEPPRARQGYYLTLGIYSAATVAREKGTTLGPWYGYGDAFRMGQLVTRRLSLGLSIEGASTWGGGQKASVTALGLEAGWALWGNLAVRGGVGIGFMRLHDPNDPTESSTRGVTGAWYSLGVSYDWFPRRKRLSGGFAITPTLQARLVPGDDTSGFVTFLGIDFSYWMGLQRNQLDLPPSEAWKKK